MGWLYPYLPLKYDDGNIGPFRDNAYLTLQLRCQRPAEENVSIVALLRLNSPFVFTYGDLIARDITDHGTRVSSIVNQECTGW